MPESFSFIFFAIFTGAAVLASLALYTRQPLLIAYILLGALLGPYGFGIVANPELISDISHIGIIFLLFLLGLDMQPSNLLHTFKKVSATAFISSIVFALVGYTVAFAAGYEHIESIVIGAAMIFSSTIIGIKLLPTTVLHHRHIGELVVGLLLIQDVLAIILLIIIQLTAQTDAEHTWLMIAKPLIALPLLILFSGFAVKYVLVPLLNRFDKFQEYIFLLALGWCLGIAEAAQLMGLSAEIGAFIAGISIASSPIAQFIALNLKPLRDFFLILFFFSVGASLDRFLLHQIIIPALLIAAMMLLLKPLIFSYLLRRLGEEKDLSWEVGIRLGQNSEFALLVSYLALKVGLISANASILIQVSAIATFLISSYIVILRYPTPIAIKDSLRRD